MFHRAALRSIVSRRWRGARQSRNLAPRSHQKERPMAKGQKRSNKEVRKPKQDKGKSKGAAKTLGPASS
jgi:hypothetical protein